MDNWYQILFNILGGLITVGIIELFGYFCKKYQNAQFKAIFGDDVAKISGFHIVYAQFSLAPSYDEKGQLRSHPFRKPDKPEIGFSIDNPISSCEVRAAKYITAIVGAQTNTSPILSPDFDLRGRLDFSFVSLGGPLSNYKTDDANSNAGNRLVNFDQNNGRFICIKAGNSPVKFDPDFHYGMILKIHPMQFPKRTWIVCAGIGEWGSSGAAWYLANKWKELYSYAKKKPFACIIRVKDKQDESAEIVYKVK